MNLASGDYVIEHATAIANGSANVFGIDCSKIFIKTFLTVLLDGIFNNRNT